MFPTTVQIHVSMPWLPNQNLLPLASNRRIHTYGDSPMRWLLFCCLLVGEEGSEWSLLVEIRGSNPCPKFGSSFSSSSSCARKELSLQWCNFCWIHINQRQQQRFLLFLADRDRREGKRERSAVTYRCHVEMELTNLEFCAGTESQITLCRV